MTASLFLVLCMGVSMVMGGALREFAESYDESDFVDDDVDDSYVDETDVAQPTDQDGLSCHHHCSKVAFTAYLGDSKERLGKGQHIKFDQVILNDGDGYKPHLGTFTAPCSGVYSFTVVVAQRNPNEIRVRLVLDGVNEVDAIAEGMHKFHDVQGTNTVNLHVKKGHHVYVETVSAGRIEGNSRDFRYTTFSGHLLYKRR